MEIKTRLVMTFQTASGSKYSISLDDPREDVTEQEILTVMNLIISKNIFEPKGIALVATVDAKIVETNTTEHDLVV